MYPPREPNARRSTEQFPGEIGYNSSFKTAISLKSSGKPLGTATPQEIADGSLGTSVRPTGTLKRQALNLPNDTDLAP
jgi:hypothetical protein